MVFEGDLEVIIDHLIADQPCLTTSGYIIEEARTLSAKLRQASYSHTRRKGNKVADKLAKLAKNLYEHKCGWRIFIVMLCNLYYLTEA